MKIIKDNCQKEINQTQRSSMYITTELSNN